MRIFMWFSLGLSDDEGLPPEEPAVHCVVA
jgi:hypothetical protein